MNQNQERDNDDDNSGKEQMEQNEQAVDESKTKNVVSFQGLIYGLPSAAPGGQFILRVKVETRFEYQEYQQQKKNVSFTKNQEKILMGKIITRTRRNSSKIGPKLKENEKNDDDDFVKNHISIMPSFKRIVKRSSKMKGKRNIFESFKQQRQRSFKKQSASDGGKRQDFHKPKPPESLDI